MPNPKTDRVDLKDPWIAAILAYLIPGAGHFYQRRIFKGILYSVCILATFFCGVRMGEGRTVYMYYYHEMQDPGAAADGDLENFPDLNTRGQGLKKRNYGYLSQVLVGLPALPALAQAYRYERVNNSSMEELEDGFEANFEGTLSGIQDNSKEIKLPAKGRIALKLEPDGTGWVVKGTFDGQVETAEGPKDVSLTLGRQLFQGSQPILGYPIYASPRRSVMSGVDDIAELNIFNCSLKGTVPRSTSNYYGVPPEDQVLQHMNRKLGKHWELAMVFTWIAGLLNILAIWDAHDGPAYGYGDEVPEDDDKTDAKESASKNGEPDGAKATGDAKKSTKPAPQTADA